MSVAIDDRHRSLCEQTRDPNNKLEQGPFVTHELYRLATCLSANSTCMPGAKIDKSVSEALTRFLPKNGRNSSRRRVLFVNQFYQVQRSYLVCSRSRNKRAGDGAQASSGRGIFNCACLAVAGLFSTEEPPSRNRFVLVQSSVRKPATCIVRWLRHSLYSCAKTYGTSAPRKDR